MAVDVVVFGSRRSHGSFASLIAGSCSVQHVIYHRVDTDYFVPLSIRYPGEVCRLLFVGILSRRKGAHLLTPIMQALGSDYQLTCVTRSAGDFPVRENITLRENVDNAELLKLYQSADILLFPTQLEGFGLTVVEAMATGLPVVSSDNSSIPELLEQGAGGWLCESNDVPDFVDRVQSLWGNPAQREAMGVFNRGRAVARYSTLGWAESCLDVYRAGALGEM